MEERRNQVSVGSLYFILEFDRTRFGLKKKHFKKNLITFLTH